MSPLLIFGFPYEEVTMTAPLDIDAILGPGRSDAPPALGVSRQPDILTPYPRGQEPTAADDFDTGQRRCGYRLTSERGTLLLCLPVADPECVAYIAALLRARVERWVTPRAALAEVAIVGGPWLEGPRAMVDVAERAWRDWPEERIDWLARQRAPLTARIVTD